MDLDPTTKTLNNGGKRKQISPSISATLETVSQLVLVLPDADFSEEVLYEVKRLKSRQRR